MQVQAKNILRGKEMVGKVDKILQWDLNKSQYSDSISLRI